MNGVKSKTSLAVSVIALLVAAPAVMASGGINSGGVNSGGGGGGGTAPTQTTPATPCVQLVSVAEQTGYYSVWAAIWHHYTIKSCSTAPETVTVSVTDTNSLTGAVDFMEYRYHQLTPNQNVGSVFDNDFAPFSTGYDATTTVTDANGNVLASQTRLATTSPQL